LLPCCQVDEAEQVALRISEDLEPRERGSPFLDTRRPQLNRLLDCVGQRRNHDVEVKSILARSWLWHLLQVDVRTEATGVDQDDVSRSSSLVLRERIVDVASTRERIDLEIA
jgi:hypothetical protein